MARKAEPARTAGPTTTTSLERGALTKAGIQRLVLRIASELRDRTTETPRTYVFTLRDDKHLRVIDQTASTGKRVLTFEAYRGSVGVLGHYPTVRLDGSAEGVWFGGEMSARDEGNALTVLENAVVTQLSGGDHAQHVADVQVDVRDGAAGAAPYAPRFRPVDYARVLARGPLLVAFWSFVVAWIAFAVGEVWAASVDPMPAASALSIVGILLPHLLAVIALMVAGFAGRSGNGVRTMVLAILAFIWVPLASATPVGPFLAVVGGALMVAAAASAAAVRVRAPVVGFIVCALAAATAGTALAASAPAVAAVVVAIGMIGATAVAALLIRRASNRAAAVG